MNMRSIRESKGCFIIEQVLLLIPINFRSVTHPRLSRDVQSVTISIFEHPRTLQHACALQYQTLKMLHLQISAHASRRHSPEAGYAHRMRRRGGDRTGLHPAARLPRNTGTNGPTVCFAMRHGKGRLPARWQTAISTHPAFASIEQMRR